jgi:hypothetical protein
MNGIVGAVGDSGRRDLFYLDEDFQMKQRTARPPTSEGESPWIVDWIELGGIFTSMPAVVSSMGRRRILPPIDVGELHDVEEVEGGPEGHGPPDGGPILPAHDLTALEDIPSFGRLHRVGPAVPGHEFTPADDPGAEGEDGAVSFSVGGTGELEQRIDVFGLGLDRALYGKTLWGAAVDQPGPWRNLGGVFTSAPAAIWLDGQLHVFGLGSDLAMYWRTYGPAGWSDGWARIGGYFSSPPVVVSWGPGRFDLFARHADFSLRRRVFQGGTWDGDWQNLGASLASAPAVVTWGEDRLDVFAVGNLDGIAPDGGLIHRWWDGDIWNDWEQIAGLATGDEGIAFTSAPAAASWGPGRLDVFAVDTDGTLRHTWFADSAWSNPEPVGPEFKMRTTPMALVTGPQELEVVAPGRDRNLWRMTLTGAGWSTLSWTQMGDHLRLPSQYRISVDLLRCNTPRSLKNDTVTGQCSLKIGNWPIKVDVDRWPLAPRSQRQGDLGLTTIDEGQTNLMNFDPVTIELHEAAAFGYAFVNSNEEPGAVMAVLDTVHQKIADFTLEKIVDRAKAANAKIDSVTIGSVAAPVTGALIGILAPWVAEQLVAILEDNCDGGIALENFVRRGTEWAELVAGGAPVEMRVEHDGGEHPFLCGADSEYVVFWSIRRSRE